MDSIKNLHAKIIKHKHTEKSINLTIGYPLEKYIKKSMNSGEWTVEPEF